MQLVKSHGLGNDYLVLATGEAMSAARAQALCDRHVGVGGDGVLEPCGSDVADHGLRIWNPDGSTAEKSGNGLRIFSRWLVDHRSAGRIHTIEVPGGVVRCVVHDDGEVTVDMGAPEWRPALIPCEVPLYDTAVVVAGATLRLTAVSMGNPHCVAVFEPGTDLDAVPWRTWGALLETDRRFPNRTNVQFAVVRAPDRVEARIWERGAGETLASGSSACAVAVVAHRLGRAAAHVTVEMPGGTLDIDHADDGIRMRGPVIEVGIFTVTMPVP